MNTVSPSPVSALVELVRSPSPDARGLTRWWWYGCAVTESEIERELDFMQAAGIGGVELQILYAVTPDDPEKGIYNIPFGSPRFYEILAFTKAACDKRGMTLDITPGSSWPYGGPMIGPEDAQQEALPYQLDLHGPQRFSMDFTTRFAGDVACAALGKMEHSVMLPETVRDVTKHFEIKYLFGWPWGTQAVDIEVPEGDWKLVFFVVSMHRNHVGKPGRNAQGLVIDHCSRRAMDTFLRHMVEPIARHVPGVNAYFCDSIEVEGHNWSGVLLEEFEKRRGYSLAPYVYALWGDMGDITPRVRYDYFKTMSELTIENFFDPLTEFAHRHGAKSRIQAHGTWGDILRVYAAADIPEGETFGDHRTLEVNTIHRRLAASAGHVYGKKLISNETFTWLKRPRFTETLEELKAAVDAVFVDGINMIVNHGYAYSPECAGKRGWPFYASTHINHTAPWWPQYRCLGRYIASVSAVLREGQHVSDIAVYLPQSDVYAENMLSELHLAMRLEEHLGRRQMDALQKAGYWFDYINDEALENETVLDRYRAVLLIGCKRMPAKGAWALRGYFERGGTLLCAEQKPSMGTGLIGYEEETRQVLSAFDADIPVAPDREEGLLKLLKALVPPGVRVSDPEHIGWVQRQSGDEHIYFLSNLNDAASEFDISFFGRSERAAIIRPVSGERHPFTRNEEGGLRLRLDAHESVFVLFSPALKADDCAPQREYSGNLPVVFERLDIPERGLSFPIDRATDWTEFEELRDFSGVGVYHMRVTAPCDTDAMLAIAHVSCAAQVYVNGKDCGVLWTHPLRLPITLKKGENEIELRAHSTLINEMRAALGHDETDVWPDSLTSWPYYGKIINDELRQRMNLRREHEEQKEPVASGVWGEVRILVP